MGKLNNCTVTIHHNVYIIVNMISSASPHSQDSTQKCAFFTVNPRRAIIAGP